MEFGDLRGILHYVPKFRNKLFVIKLDGAVVHSDNMSNIVLDLAVLNSLKVNYIIVHDLIRQDGVDQKKENNDKIPTTSERLELQLNESSKLTNILMRELTAVGLKVASANSVIARSKGVINGVDYPHDGKVEKIDDVGLMALIEKGIIPILSSIAFDKKGRNYLLDSDDLAFAVGSSTGCSKVIFLTATDMVNSVNGIEFTVSQATNFAEDEVNRSKRLSKILLEAAKVCTQNVDRVHILNGLHDYAILAELFVNEGVGIMVHRDPYGMIRSASDSDVSEVLSIIQSAIRDDELLPRSSLDITSRINDFYVLEIDDNVVGTVALHSQGEVAEMACLFVKKSHEGVGYGSRLVKYIFNAAKEREIKKIYALSTQASGFFESLGWIEGGLNDLNEPRRQEFLNSGRNSKIFYKCI
jgi:amino-acid N-acetyltransferase